MYNLPLITTYYHLLLYYYYFHYIITREKNTTNICKSLIANLNFFLSILSKLFYQNRERKIIWMK
nr:MAG TPA: hypothetical protein [Caudoviricetes sp.]